MLANWVKETTATVGTGAIALGGAPAGFVPFSDAFPGGGPVYYAVEDGSNRELGIGTLAPGNPWTLTRTWVMETLSGGMFDDTSPPPLNLSGAALVMASGSTASLTISDRPLVATTKKWMGGNTTIAGGASSNAANTMCLYPILVGGAVTIDALCVNLSVAAAGSLTKVGVYDVDSDGWPRKLVTSVAIDSSTTGDKIVGVAPLTLRPGWYWVASCTSDAVVKTSKGVGYSAIYASPVGRYSLATGANFPFTTSLGAGWGDLPVLSPGPLVYGYITAMLVHLRVAS